jgi:hypothetical protein
VKDTNGNTIVSILLEDEKKFEILKLFADQAKISTDKTLLNIFIKRIAKEKYRVMLQEIINRDTLTKEDLNEMDVNGFSPIHHFAQVVKNLYSECIGRILKIVKVKLIMG